MSFFEGNEIQNLKKKRVDEKEIVLLSIDESLDEFQRALCLLSK